MLFAELQRMLFADLQQITFAITCIQIPANFLLKPHRPVIDPTGIL